MKAVNQTPAPATLAEPAETEQIPMAVESFAHSLGISLTEEQKSQLHGLLKRPNQDTDGAIKRRKTEATQMASPGHCIEQKLNEPCESKLNNSPPADSKDQLEAKIPKKATRTQLIQELLQNQPPERTAGQHHVIETAGYIKCQHCGSAILKRSKEATWTEFINSPCIDEAYKGEAIGHAAHCLWQLGTKVTCKHCGLAVLTEKDNRLIITRPRHSQCRRRYDAYPAGRGHNK